jgi:hypothetical protein
LNAKFNNDQKKSSKQAVTHQRSRCSPSFQSGRRLDSLQDRKHTLEVGLGPLSGLAAWQANACSRHCGHSRIAQPPRGVLPSTKHETEDSHGLACRQAIPCTLSRCLLSLVPILSPLRALVRPRKEALHDPYTEWAGSRPRTAAIWETVLLARLTLNLCTLCYQEAARAK